MHEFSLTQKMASCSLSKSEHVAERVGDINTGMRGVSGDILDQLWYVGYHFIQQDGQGDIWYRMHAYANTQTK